MQEISYFETNSAAMYWRIIIECSVVHHIRPHAEGHSLGICPLKGKDGVLFSMVAAWKGSPIVGQGLPRVASILLVGAVAGVVAGVVVLRVATALVR